MTLPASTPDTFVGTLANGNIQFVRILLSEAVETLTVELMHNRTNDGFGIDGVAVANVAPVPLPPAAALMLPFLLSLVGLRRRRAACAWRSATLSVRGPRQASSPAVRPSIDC